MKLLYKLPRDLKDENGKLVKRIPLEKYTYHGGDLNLKVGSLKKDDLTSGLINKDKEKYALFNAQHIDLINHFGRKAQVITSKDAGLIISETGINKESVVLESGTGSGSLTSFLAGIAKKVVSVEINDKNIEQARKNINKTNFQAEILKGDIKSISLKQEFDVIILDLLNPEEAFDNILKNLKPGGFLVLYLPNITQVQQALSKKPDNIITEKTFEVIQRDWKVSDKIARPETKDFGHTAFISILRKVF